MTWWPFSRSSPRNRGGSRTSPPDSKPGSEPESDPGTVDVQLAAWLDQPGLDVTDVDAAVVGTETGTNAMALAQRGAVVTALGDDPAAVDAARRRHGARETAHPVTWRHVATGDLPADLVGRFGLVVDTHLVSDVPPPLRDQVMQAVANLVGDGGWLVAVVRLATSDQARTAATGPPPLAPSELTGFAAAGLDRIELHHPVVDDPGPWQPTRTVWMRPDRPTPPVA